MPNLPFDLLEEIIRRLPVKSLKRFRCVAKAWCFLIDSEKFVKSHLHQSLISKSHRHRHRHLLLGGVGLYKIDLNSLDKTVTIKPPFPYQTIDGVSNSCNGLVMILSEPPTLWNPFTTEYKIIPGVCAEHSAPRGSYSKVAYGFAYDSKKDDYKVVRAVEHRQMRTHIWMFMRTEIYSLKSNSWREIEDFPYSPPFITSNWRVHVNGALHTLLEPTEESDIAKIMAFSVETEKHYEVEMPKGLKVRDVDMVLDMVGGCLSLICASRSRVDIWVMKEYRVRSSWTKLMSPAPPTLENTETVKSLVFSDDGAKVLLNCDDKRLCWYDTRSKTSKRVPVKDLPYLFYAEVCVESLVSLYGPDEVKKRGLEVNKVEKNKKKRDDFLSVGFKLKF